MYEDPARGTRMYPAHTTEQMVGRLTRLRNRIEYRDGYRLRIGTTPGMKYPFIQVVHARPDSTTGSFEEGYGGKSYVSEHATDSEIFQMILGLLIAYETHEVREFFRVDGKRIYGPHIDSAALAEVCDRLDARAPQE